MRGIHLSLVDSPHKGQWSGALMFSLICTWTNGWARNRGTGDLRRYRAHYDVTMIVSSSVIANCMRNIDFLSFINFSTICILNKKFAAFHLQFHLEGVTFKTSFRETWIRFITPKWKLAGCQAQQVNFMAENLACSPWTDFTFGSISHVQIGRCIWLCK